MKKELSESKKREWGIVQTVILIAGGDAGGLILTEHGVRSIPPFDPAILKSLKSASCIVQAISKARTESIRRKMTKQAIAICNLAVEQIEQVLGPLDSDRSVIFQDNDGGFACGSIGKPPIALQWPPNRVPTIQDLVKAGSIQSDLIELAQKAGANKVDITDLFEKPMEIAQELGVSLSLKSAKDLNILAPSKLNDIKDETDREIVKFLHAVIKDGRFLQIWLDRPYEVSQSLKFKLSDSALERLVTRGASGADWGTVAIIPIFIEIIVEVAIFVIEWIISEPTHLINDRSGLKKI